MSSFAVEDGNQYCKHTVDKELVERETMPVRLKGKVLDWREVTSGIPLGTTVRSVLCNIFVNELGTGPWEDLSWIKNGLKDQKQKVGLNGRFSELESSKCLCFTTYS